VRIVGGAFRGRTIRAPAGAATRPTSDRAREAIFNQLEHAAWSPGLSGVAVIDLFAGSGALGLEALSRGAALCVFVEADEQARASIRDNLDALDPSGSLAGRSRILRRDATTLGPSASAGVGPFGLALLDPPYGGGMGERALRGLAEGGWLTPGALCVLERGQREPAIEIEGFERLAGRRYGAAKTEVFRWSAA